MSQQGMASSELRLGFIGFILVLIVIGALGSLSSARRSQPAPVVHYGYHGLPDFNVDADASEAELKKLALRTRGDYSQLTPDERVWIEGMSASHGEQVLGMMAKRYLAEEKHHAAASGKSHGGM